MLASMIFRKEPFFHGHDNYDQVNKSKLFLFPFLFSLKLFFAVCLYLLILKMMSFIAHIKYTQSVDVFCPSD